MDVDTIAKLDNHIVCCKSRKGRFIALLIDMPEIAANVTATTFGVYPCTHDNKSLHRGGGWDGKMQIEEASVVNVPSAMPMRILRLKIAIEGACNSSSLLS